LNALPWSDEKTTTDSNSTSVYNWANNLISTVVSFNSIHVAKNELHTDISWLNGTWKPSLDNDEHGIILHDSISLSPYHTCQVRMSSMKPPKKGEAGRISTCFVSSSIAMLVSPMFV